MSITDSNILLETGTNELEILEFTIAGHSFGINVAKITELMQIQDIQPMPLSHPCVEGVFQPRDEVYSIVNLAKYLGLPASENSAKDIYIITNFNMMNVGFHVHAVESIYRISWQAIEKPDAIVFGGDEGVVTGIAKVEDRIIAILDFEKITYDICPATGIQLSAIQEIKSSSERANCPVLVAEDSALLRKMLHDALEKAGYMSVTIKNDGQEAWEHLSRIKQTETAETLRSQVCCVITDIEMPQMDGHRLTKLIKSDTLLSALPVVIFSSLIDANMEKKGIEVGADAQLSKPEISKLVEIVDSLINSK